MKLPSPPLKMFRSSCPSKSPFFDSKYKKARRRVFNYHSVDRLRGQDLTEVAQQSVWNVASSVSKDALGILPLFHGMRVMIAENVAIRNRLVNGMEGIVKHIDYDIDESNRQYAKACYVLVERSGIQLEGFEPDVVPILPVQQSFTFKSQLGEWLPHLPSSTPTPTRLLLHRLQESG
jgi:hypothetical protein